MVRIGLQIRFEVMNVINKNPLKSVKLPSAQELADKFGMSRRSVTMELKKLAEEGWILGVHGVGTFTNPERLISALNLPSRRIIGIGMQDSRQYCYDAFSWHALFSMGKQIIPEIGYPHCVRLSSNDPDIAFQELKSLNLDAFLWGFPSPHLHPVLKRLFESGIPVVTFPQRIPGVPSVEVDFERCGEAIAEHLLAEGRKNILWCAFDKLEELRLKGAEKTFRKAGYPMDPRLIVPQMNELEGRLRALLENRKVPEAVVLHGNTIYLVGALLEEYGIRPFDGTCRLAADELVVQHVPGFRGIVLNYPYPKIFQKMIRLLKELFSGKTPEIPDKAEMEIRFIP